MAMPSHQTSVRMVVALLFSYSGRACHVVLMFLQVSAGCKLVKVRIYGESHGFGMFCPLLTVGFHGILEFSTRSTVNLKSCHCFWNWVETSGTPLWVV